MARLSRSMEDSEGPHMIRSQALGSWTGRTVWIRSMRKLLFVVLALGTALASAAASAAPAPEWVEFTTATTPPTPFALKQAKAQGIELQQEAGTPLRGCWSVLKARDLSQQSSSSTAATASSPSKRNGPPIWLIGAMSPYSPTATARAASGTTVPTGHPPRAAALSMHSARCVT